MASTTTSSSSAAPTSNPTHPPFISDPITATPPPQPPFRLLIINPNSTSSMTNSLHQPLLSLPLPPTTYTFFTAPPPSPPSINTAADARFSAEVCFPLVTTLLEDYDGVVVACYSEHPLVGMVRGFCARRAKEAEERVGGNENEGKKWREKVVMGIFEGSVINSMQLLAGSAGLVYPTPALGGSQQKKGSAVLVKWGIITTGKVWEELLTDAVWRFFSGGEGKREGGGGGEGGSGGGGGGGEIARFAGVASTGLNATELHDLPREEVDKKMKDAAKNLLLKHMNIGDDVVQQSKIGVLCLGCAGMVGLEEVIGQAAVEVGYKPGELRVVDGVRAGVLIVDSLLRGSRGAI